MRRPTEGQVGLLVSFGVGSVSKRRSFPRNPVGGPGTHSFDLSVFKMFHMPYNEKHTLQFCAEFFNAFNTPQFSNPDSDLEDSTFGQVLSTAHGNREIRLALKYVF